MYNASYNFSTINSVMYMYRKNQLIYQKHLIHVIFVNAEVMILICICQMSTSITVL